MQIPMSNDINNNLIVSKISFLSSYRLISLILNIILSLVICIFIFCFIRFMYQEKETLIIHTNKLISVIDERHIPPNLSHNRTYYDFEKYLINNTFQKENKTRRYFYIDLGCFDGRDADYFVHFHLEEISNYGALQIIAFEPDPINFVACKLAQQKRSSISTTIHDSAVWIKDGQVRYATEKGQKSKIDPNSTLSVRSIDFSRWLKENFHPEDFIYVKFTVAGAEIDILEKLVRDKTLLLLDIIEIEWSKGLSPDFEARRVVLECMLDNFGMDFIYIINPVDLKHAYNVKDKFASIPKDRVWKLDEPYVRFHYKTRKDVPSLLAQRLQRKQYVSSSSSH